MNYLDIEINLKNTPVLDSDFIPAFKFNEAFLKTAKQTFGIALERSNGQIAVFNTFIHGTKPMFSADVYYIDRLLKMLLWMKGGFAVYLCGQNDVCEEIKNRYSANGKHAFDNDFMANIYGKPFTVTAVKTLPSENSNTKAVGRHTDGCRIGFDAGGSDRKVSAVIDGESVFSEEVVWHPKTNENPDYHFEGIVSALKTAAKHLPRVDAIGVSSAGIFIDNETKAASLFLKVPKDLFNEKVKDIYTRAAKEIGDVPVEVCNDGDVTALAGAISLDENNVLGIAMGTSEAVGYVDADGNITGWLNELAFAPVDYSPNAMKDEWSLDIGVGCKYFSQDAVIKLAPAANIELDENLYPAQKLKIVQELMEKGDERAVKIYETIGAYLAHTLVNYHSLYNFRHVLLLGRVMSGKGGDIILSTCTNILKDEYPLISKQFIAALPDEKFRRVGQSAAAASLPEIK